MKNNNILNNKNLSKDFKIQYLFKNIINNCKSCNLYKNRNKIVFGEGNLNTTIIFIGEAPGKKEDIEGIPFVGAAGSLLNKIIIAMNLHRKNIYICNIIKCKPINNITPSFYEIQQCKKFLEYQISIIQPKIIITLGKSATNALLNKNDFISKMRGKWHMYNNILVMPTFHPAYLLRNPHEKRKAWSDFKSVITLIKNKNL